MRKFLLTSLVLLTVSLNFLQAQNLANPVDYYGRMQVHGNKIHGMNRPNEPMQVKGASFFWSHWSEQFYTTQMVDEFIDEWDVELLRFAWSVGKDGKPLYHNYDKLYEIVDYCIERGVYIIIDWHSHGMENDKEAAKSFWRTVVPRYANNPAVIFELYNEPEMVLFGGPDWTVIKAAQEEIIPVIRGFGANNLIIAGTEDFSQRVDKAASNPIRINNEPDQNLAYALHYYVPNHCNGVWEHIDDAMNGNIALFATEWGFWKTEEWSQCGNWNYDKQTVADIWEGFLNDNKISSASWAITDKEEELSSLLWDQGFGGPWLRNMLDKWAETAPWRCLDEVITRIEIEGDLEVYPGEETQLEVWGYTSCKRVKLVGNWSANATNGLFSSTEVKGHTVSVSASGFNTTATVNVVNVNGTIIGDSELEDGQGNPITQMCTPWYVHKDNNGEVTYARTQPGVLGTANAATINYNIIQGELDYQNQAGLGINLTDDETGFDLAGSTGISFWYKGEAVDLQVSFQSMNEAENWDKFHVSVPTTNDWKIYNYQWADFVQYGWGTPATFDLTEAVNFIWMRNGVDGEVASLSVDEVYILDKDFETCVICDDFDMNEAIINAAATSTLINVPVSVGVIAKSTCQNIDMPADAVITWSNNVQNGEFVSPVEGTFDITVDVVSGGATFQDTVSISVITDPDVVILPALVQAENYYDSLGIQTEVTEDVGGGRNVGWVDPGDWISFKVNVSQATNYEITYRVASLEGNGTILVGQSPNSSALGSIAVDVASGWQGWEDRKHEITLPAGTYELYFSAGGEGGYNINWIDFDQGCQDDLSLARIEVIEIDGKSTDIVSLDDELNFAVNGFTPCDNDYSVDPADVTWTGADNGKFVATEVGPYTVTASVTVNGTTVEYTVEGMVTEINCESSVIVQAEDYIDMDGVQTEPTQDIGGGLNVGWIDEGDWMVYEVNLPCAQTYNLKARVSTPNYNVSARVELSDQTVLGTLNIPHTGSWQTWQDANVKIDLPAGVSYITIASNSNGWNINWIEFTKDDGSGEECTQWQPNTNYPIGTVVSYNGNNYTSNNDWNGTAGAPDVAIWGWNAGGTCSGMKSAEGDFESLTQNYSVSLYPNPQTGDVLNIAVSSEFNYAVVTIYDVYGKARVQETFEGETSIISTHDLENGTYLLKSVIDNEVVIEKLIINR